MKLNYLLFLSTALISDVNIGSDQVSRGSCEKMKIFFFYLCLSFYFTLLRDFFETCAREVKKALIKASAIAHFNLLLNSLFAKYFCKNF